MNNNIKQGLFLTVEGIEGVGKTTNIEFIKSCFEQRGLPLLLTREPGGTAIAEQIRELLLSNQAEKLQDDAELLLIFAARVQHLNLIIKPALLAGKAVLCDRFTDATYAYQGGGRNISQSKIAQLEQLVQGDLRPDLTFILDASVEVGMARVAKRGKLDRFEKERHVFFERVRAAYLRIAKANPNPMRYSIIQADQPLVDVQKDILALLQQKVFMENSI